MTQWHIITCEYPPQPGGVSDYTQLVAGEMAKYGEEVHVWCPPVTGSKFGISDVMVHRELGRLAPSDLKRVGEYLDQFNVPRRLLVQWVPHGYGYRSMNLSFCWWLWRRAREKGDLVDLMVHEPYLGFSFKSLKQSGVALAHRLMTILLLQAARRVWLSIPAWESRLRPYSLGKNLPMAWLPIPSNIAVVNDPGGVSEVHSRYTSDGQLLLGHFGTYGKVITELLQAVLPEVMQRHPQVVLLLLGRGGEQWRDEFARRYPALADRVHAPGALTPVDLSRHVSACDLMFQPYPDGISSRRTSAMASLAHGKPLVTNEGLLSESLWRESDAVALAPTPEISALRKALVELLDDEDRRNRLRRAAFTFYKSHFDIQHVVSRLRNAASPLTTAVTRQHITKRMADLPNADRSH